MGALVTLLGSVFSGGVTGLLGVAVQRIFDFLKVKQEIQMKTLQFEQDIKLRELDQKGAREEAEARFRIVDREQAGAENVAAESSFAASFNMEPKQYSANVVPNAGQSWMLVVLDFIRGIVRPGLTVYLCWVTTLCYIEVNVILKQIKYAISADQAVTIYQQVLATILYLTTTCVLWWFGTRNKQQPPKVSQAKA